MAKNGSRSSEFWPVRLGQWVSASEARSVRLDPWLVAKLVCPATRTPLRWDEAAGELVSDAAGLAYPVRGGMPVLIAEAARQLRTGDVRTG